jgi:hypothetical protein
MGTKGSDEKEPLGAFRSLLLPYSRPFVLFVDHSFSILSLRPLRVLCVSAVRRIGRASQPGVEEGKDLGPHGVGLVVADVPAAELVGVRGASVGVDLLRFAADPVEAGGRSEPM